MLEVFTALVKDSRHAGSVYLVKDSRQTGSVYCLSEGFKVCWKCLHAGSVYRIQGMLEVFTSLVKDSWHAGSVYCLSKGFKACWKCLLP